MERCRQFPGVTLCSLQCTRSHAKIGNHACILRGWKMDDSEEFEWAFVSVTDATRNDFSANVNTVFATAPDDIIFLTMLRCHLQFIGLKCESGCKSRTGNCQTRKEKMQRKCSAVQE